MTLRQGQQRQCKNPQFSVRQGCQTSSSVLEGTRQNQPAIVCMQRFVILNESRSMALITYARANLLRRMQPPETV
jgi:hypothetical protein